MTQVSVQDALRLAQQHRDAGRFRDAESIYRDIYRGSSGWSQRCRKPVATVSS